MYVLISRLVNTFVLTVIVLAVGFGICSRMPVMPVMAGMQDVGMSGMNMDMSDCEGSLQTCPISFLENLRFISQVTPLGFVDLLQLVAVFTALLFVGAIFHNWKIRDESFKIRWKGYLFELLRSYPQPGLAFALSQGIINPKLYT